MTLDITTGRDIVLLALFVLVRDGTPWLMKTLFPAVWGEKAKAAEEKRESDRERQKTADALQIEQMKYRKDVEDREFAFKREMQEKEFERQKEAEKREFDLRREVSDRDAAIEARNSKMLEGIEKNVGRLTEAIGAMAMQLTVVGGAVAGMKKDQDAYFAKGEKAIKQISDMAKKKP